MQGFGFGLFQRRVFVVFELDIGIEVGIEGTKLFWQREVEGVGYQWLRDAVFDFEARRFEIMAISESCECTIIRRFSFVLYLYALAVGKGLGRRTSTTFGQDRSGEIDT